MSMHRVFTLAFLAARMCYGQSEGLPPEWEARKLVQEMIDKLKPVGPFLNRLDAGKWVERGAPPAYREQLKAAQDQFDYTLGAAQRLLQQPDRLSIAMETGLRVQSLEFMLLSIAEVVRRYQNGAIADLLISQLGESAAPREKFRQYVVQLAAAKEEELNVADREAQRCRDMLSRQPVSLPKPSAPKPAPAKKEVKK